MTDKDQELMERYIYQVVKRLPRDQRREVSMELRELISDMLEEGESMDKVLEKLGDPAKFAEKYQDRAHQLIGPEYYDTWLWFVKVVLLCSSIPTLVVRLVEAFIHTGRADVGENVLSLLFFRELTEAVGDVLFSCVFAFGAVTLIFAVLEYQKIKLDMKKEEKWYLTPVPDKKALISRGDCIVSIVFTVIFAVLLIFAPQFFAAVLLDTDPVTFLPIFNLERWPQILPVFVVSLFFGLADEIVRLVAGVYGKTVLISNLVCNGISLVLSVILLKVLPIWNPDFTGDLLVHLGVTENPFDMLTSFNGDTFSNIFLGVIVFAIVLDSGTTIYKTVRYGVRE